jgi:dihydroorotate dehydrogenase electron transfer subunit
VFDRMTLPVDIITVETDDVRTFAFREPLAATPGQFVMVSGLDGDEKPFSLSDCSEDGFSFTVRRVGRYTARLFESRPGDLLSIRGAYGSSFFVRGSTALIVGGGCAVPPLHYLCRKLADAGVSTTFVNGARDRQALLFADRIDAIGTRQFVALESATPSVTAVDVALNLLKSEKFDHLYAAGPELMMVALAAGCGSMDYQFLIERYMKCGIGICGSCTLDPIGLRVCVEGPVLPRATVERPSEFGRYRRNGTGARVPIGERRVCE